MRNRKILITLLCAAFLTGCAAEQEAEKAPEQELEKYTNLSADAGFDTVYQQTEFGYDHDLMAEHYTKAVSMFSSFNDLFDIYNEYEGIGNLMTINANAGIAPVETDQRIIDMLKEAKMFYEISGGAFDITIGSLLHVWHEYRDRGIALNQQGTKAPIPSDEELKEAAEKCGWDKVVIDEENKTVFITEKGVSLDVGGIAKGYAAEAIGQFMETQDVVYATINAGRNIRTVHSKADGKPWSIGITDPSDGNSLYCAVEMDGSGSFVTSGDYERYYIGEELDLSGLVVSATMANGTSTVISHDRLVVSGFDNQKEGSQTIGVSYTSPITDVTYNMSFNVEVVSGLNSIAITSQPAKTVYYYSDTLDTAGLVVTAYYANNTSKAVTDKCVLSGYNMNAVGRQTVTVTFTEGSVSKTATFGINVKDYATSIYISNMPSKLNYNLGEPLSTASLAVKAHFAVGTDKAVTSSVVCSGFESETPGVKTVTVSYSTDKGVLQTFFSVTVFDAVKSLNLTSGLDKTMYNVGEELDTASLAARAELSTGQIIDVPYSDLSVSGYNPNQKGRQIVSVKYNYDSSELSLPLKVFVEYDDSCDVNGDLFVDLSDISSILSSGNYSLPAQSAQNKRCDVNADGNVDILDIGEVLNENNYAKAIGC